MTKGATLRHQCMIYDGPPSRILPALVATIRGNLDAHMRCMYMNSPAMVAGLRSGLYAAGTDVERELARGSQLFHKHTALSGICQYHRDLLPREAVREGLVSHASLFINETISRLNPHYVLAQAPNERMVAARPALDDALVMLLAAEM